MNDLSLDVGFASFKAPTVSAYAGHAGRVHAREADAIIDEASNTLAQRWLKGCDTTKVPFATFVAWIADDIELAEAAIKLARFKIEHSKP